jgi:hypothetical protein
MRAAASASGSHSVYVVLLDPAAAEDPVVRRANPNREAGKPCVYVGLTGLRPEDRLANHFNGRKAAEVVRRYGIRLLPELYEWLNPMPYAAALEMERELAEDLRRQGYTVAGGH